MGVSIIQAQTLQEDNNTKDWGRALEAQLLKEKCYLLQIQTVNISPKS